VTSKALAVVLIVLGVGATLAGLYGQVFLAENEGHHDGRTFSLALEAASGADELVVVSDAPNTAALSIERAGQPIESFSSVHGGTAQIFAVTTDLTQFEHVTEFSDVLGSYRVPSGDVRVIVQAAPSGGADFVELGATANVQGDPNPVPNITSTDEWTDGALTIRRQGFDFVLSEAWNGDDLFDGPAFLSLIRSGDLAFTHGHAELVGDDRFSFAMRVPGSGDYLAALEFEQNGEVVKALFRFTV
jgi:hypothetical protein